MQGSNRIIIDSFLNPSPVIDLWDPPALGGRCLMHLELSINEPQYWADIQATFQIRHPTPTA